MLEVSSADSAAVTPRGRPRWSRCLGGAWLMAALALAGGPAARAADDAAAARAARLAKVKSWTYQLQQLDDAKLHADASDLVVID